VALVLTQQRLSEKVSEHEVRVVCLDTEWESIAVESKENAPLNCRADNQAYVIYTSGSSGLPKGVMVTHRALVNRALAMAEIYGMGASDRLLQFFSLSFDAASEEIFTTLVSGGSLVLHANPAQMAPEDFLCECERVGVTIQQLAPAYWHQIVDEIEGSQRVVPPCLRVLVSGGESPSIERLHKWAQMTGGRSRFINAYGPTEATITATSYEVPLQEQAIGQLISVPIGRPVFNTTAYILDPHLQPVPVGVAGELYLGGAGLARGYWGRPDTTAQMFIPNPFSATESGSRLYRTGDLARYRADGQIEFVGRTDHQVKIRGFRVELGEIEAVLRTYPAVDEAVVTTRQDARGDKRIVAYVVVKTKCKPMASELRHHLKDRLPEYMTPSSFVLLDQLPRTPSGKLDRRRLPVPEQIRPELQEAFVAPRNEIEERLVRIWSEVLAVNRIGINDNFFDLGGDSILSLQIIARANEAGLQLTPKKLFQHQTVAGLAAVATRTKAIQAEQGAASGAVPLTPIQHWFFEQNLSEPHHWNQAVLLEAQKPLDASLLQRLVQRLLAHHDALRLRFDRGKSSWYQFNATAEENEVFSVIDLSMIPASGRGVAMKGAAAELQSTLNLSDGPILRVALFDLGAELPNHLAIIVHHLAIDGVSWRVLLEDLQIGYQQLAQGEQIELAPKTTAFKRWAERLAEYAGSPDARQETTYWLTQSGVAIARLPIDHPHGLNTEASAGTVSAWLSVEETAALLREVPAAYHTQINDILLTTLAQSFARWTGAGTLLVQVEGHGREEIGQDIDLSRTIGWFTTTFPVLLEVGECFEIGEALKRTKERLRRVPHRGIGYGLLRYLSEDPATSAELRSLPQPEVSFNYLGQFDQSFAGLFKLSDQSAGPTRSARAKRSHLLEIEAKILEGRLRLDWGYSDALHRRATIENLVRDYVEALRSIIVHCQSREGCSYTPSDFPLANLNQQKLDRMVGTNRQIENIYPLSPMQQGMLFHSLYAPESAVYVEQLSFVLRRSLNVSAFKRAWQQVIDRHSVLRTSFLWDDPGAPLQIVHRNVSLACQEEDWRGLSESEQHERLEIVVKKDRQQGFDLSKAPLMRLAVIRMAEDAYQVVWSHHHLLLDGWSLSLILKQVFAFYHGFCRGEHLQLKPNRPYCDYIAWLQQQDLSAAEMFWREKLKGFRAPTTLAIDRAAHRVSGEENVYGEREIRLTAETTLRLQSLARNHQLTLNTLFQGAWALLISRYSGEDEVIFGATVAGRPESLTGIEEMVGLFINTLPVRIKTSSSDFLLPWLREQQSQQSEARQYEYSPLVEIQGWSEVPRGQPLFESILAFENYPLDAAALGREDLNPDTVRSFERTNYPLAVMVRPGAELSVKILFDATRFDAGTIARMLGHFRTLLQGMVDNPAARLADLSLLTDAECQRSLVEWNKTEANYPRNLCINELFEAQVERTPHNVAVVFGNEQLTYGELNCHANQVAHYLRTLGVGPEVHIGICMERSAKMIVGLLAILKAGGVYVPLDPTYPKQRLAFMLKDSQAPVLITQQRLLEDLPEHDARMVCLDSDWNIVNQQSAENPASLTRPDNLAYVTYTSGSTGKPKGVAVPHRAVNRLVFNTNYVTLTPSDKVAQISNASFDAATFEIWGALLHGAQLVGMTADVALSPADFAAQLKEDDISVLFLTTALFNQVASEAPWAFETIRTVLFGGEAVDPVKVETVLAQGPPQRLLHVYGPTESTTFSTWHLIDKVEDGATTIPIGRPISNTTVYLLDKNLRVVPAGIPAELYIGDEGLARGYLNQPRLTAERFIPYPFSDKPGARLYRTGDIARYLPAGEIEFIGRIDHQVKVRGFRIELEEIEAAITEHAAVRETVVVTGGEAGKEKRVVAYLVPHERRSVRTGELRRFLKQKVPDYMVPSAFITVESLPLTPNGKVDRKALPAPDRARPQIEDAFVAPRTGIEDVLTEIWSSVLDLEQVGIHDNFFELGGHSLTATRVMSRVRECFHVEIPLRSLFESPTVAGLARRIETARLADRGLQLQPIPAVSRDRGVPLSFAQQRLWFLQRLAPASTSYNIAGNISLKGQLNVPALEQSMNEIVARHEILRTSFVDADIGPVQVIAPAFGFTLTKVDLTGLADTERAGEALQRAHQEAQRPFDLTLLPLVRVTLLRLGEEEHILAVTMHHIISDGWSIRIFLREMMALYEAFSRNESSPLPELPIQYADFAAWQRQWLRGKTLQAQLEYWKQQLGGAPPTFELPADRARPMVQSGRGAQHSFALPKALTASLKTLSREEGVTLFMTLLAAFKTLLYRYTDLTDIPVGTPIANRNRADIEGLIGFFVNTLVLRTDLSGNPTFRGLLRRVREVALGAYAHQDLPFEKLVEELHPERDVSRSPLFQVMFVLQNALLPPLELSGLKLSRMDEMPTETSVFDVTLVVEEKEDGLAGSFEYDTDLFDPATIARLAGQFQTLLQSIVEDSDQRLADLPLLTAGERHQSLVDWNDTEADFPKDACIHQLFEAQVARAPDSVAVMFEDKRVSYAELNFRANQLAHYLRRVGVGPEVPVGILMERSVEMIVGVLGVVKAGGAYVPLDPAYPGKRLGFILDDSDVHILLTQEDLALSLPEHRACVVCVDRDSNSIAGESGCNPRTTVTAGNLAYVIYTSGSTGKPKGVQVEHRSLCNLVHAQVHIFGMAPDKRVLQFASLSFDASVSEIFVALSAGAALSLGTTHSMLPGPELTRLLRDHAVTTVTLPPLMLAMLTEEDFPEVRTIVAAGDACSADIVARWSEDRVFLNAYGPTEATVCAAVAECRSRERKPAIGRPIPNAQVYVLDKRLQPVPIGVAGELHIGGVGLARGYLNRPDLTAEKFIPHPFPDVPGARLYKTGDLGRFLPDGQIDFLGRLDHQVKLRGVRVELAEIEAVLCEHEAVRETLVMAREDATGEKSLVAYVIADRECPPSTSELRGFLRERLPHNMVPSAFVFLDAFPTTSSGKVDRQALPGPEGVCAQSTMVYAAPQTELERIIAGIWQETLQIDNVGRNDNFFDLGGHSLLVVHVHRRLQERFEADLSLIEMFRYPTVGSLAHYLSRGKDGRPAIRIHERAEARRQSISRRRRKRHAMNWGT
jgi:amino acid adenylation domain-containing protein/non-ribosomal peptide synthase protein (TIGR01720 family)